MKKRTSPFFVILAVLTGATLLPATRGELAKANTNSSPDAALTEAKQSDPAQPPAEPARPNGVKKAARLSFGVDEVVKMYQGGVETDVILNYVENSSVPYHLNAEEIVQLHDIGVPSPIVTALIRHGAKMQQQAATAYAQSQAKATEEAKAASAYANAYSTSVYSPPPPVAYSYPTYVTSYPAYAYPGYSYYPSYSYYPGYRYSPFYFRFGYNSGFHHFNHYYPRYYYPHRGFASYPHFTVGARFGHSPRWGIGVRF